MSTMTGRAPSTAALLLLVLLSACQSTPPPPTSTSVPPTPTPAQPTATLDANTCLQRITTVNLADDATIANAGGCRFTPGGEEAARQVLVGGGTRDQIWAAVWIYGSTALDPAPLMTHLGLADTSVRAIAAAVVAALGERAGLDSLIESLAETGPLAGSSPPTTIAEFAAFHASRLVTGAGAPSASPGTDPAAQVSAWRAWLEFSGARLVFDQGTSAWRLP